MFRNRGQTPNINIEKNNNTGYSAPHYSNYWNENFIVIQYDKTFIVIELISSLIIILTAIAVYLFAYKVPFEDPILSVKNNILNAQLILIVCTIITTGLITFFTKTSKESLIRSLRIITFISMLTLFIMFVIKMNIDSKYNENTFGDFYEQYEASNKNNSNKINVDLSGVKITSSKQAYIEKSQAAYNNFTLKSILYMVIHLLLAVVIFYLSYRLSTIERKKDKLAKDDAILYDDEENIKY